MLAKNLQDEKYTLVTDYQDIMELFNFVDFPKKYMSDITAAIVAVEDGDYTEIWLTESNNPYLLEADYQKLSYYRPSWWTKKNLPHYWLD